eukprot:537313-Pleurochrysis_carterae.AAC.1
MAVSVAALLLTRAVVGFVPTGTHRATGCSQAPRTCTMRCNALLVVAPKLLSSQLHFPSAMHAAPMSMARPSVQSRASLKCALAEERIESVKVGFVSLLSGSVLMAPLALLEPGAFSAQWELAHDMLPLMLGLFGIVYRYAVRSDENDMLKQVFCHTVKCTRKAGTVRACCLLSMGVVGAFAITRSLSALQVSSTCSALPLSCGPPFGCALLLRQRTSKNVRQPHVPEARLYGMPTITLIKTSAHSIMN